MPIGAGTTPVAVSVQLTGLAFDALHLYQFTATNGDGDTTDFDVFTTHKLEPTVTMSAATAVTTTSATLSGTVHPHGLPTSRGRSTTTG